MPSSQRGARASALGLIAEQGLERTKIDKIAEASGVPRRRSTNYFAGKEDVLADLLEHMLTEIADESAIATASRSDAAAKLAAVRRCRSSASWPTRS